ncbi:glycosyltransferase [Alkalihalophilus pseudofirmus]|uniref:glycosyltransferase family 4 protein n=1 Tax=Alkalihalophilus pseudofirmus TaxID=79885 RepID=UPI00259BD280|nr:glycosyltransferase [Alkalihalophilus pseudofirmus]WEG15361.1 glycosyltransferase [Alkalihalophilus pseudofirmus]
MRKHLLIYDRIWWIQGQRALILQKYHESLDIMSYHDLINLIKKIGAHKINEAYEVISTLSLWSANALLKHNIRIDSSIAGSYSHFINNQNDFREWCDHVEPNELFVNEVLKKIKKVGAVNPKLSQTIKMISPETNVKYVKSFVDSEKFKPLLLKKTNTNPIFTIGWVGNYSKLSKNYYTLYHEVKKAFENNKNVKFVEATKASRIPHENMPDFYRSLDLLLVTASNEGLPNPAMEAYSTGVPVLATNIGIIKEWATPKAKSLILDTDSPKEFVTKIKDLLNNREVLNGLKNELRMNILTHWQIQPNVQEWLSTLFEINKK